MVESVLMKDCYHVLTGLNRLYAVDAQNAVSMHPDEWSFSPWSEEDAGEARKRLNERHARDVEEAKAAGLPLPAPPPPEVEPTPEEQEAIDNYNREVAEAKERLAAVREKQAEEKKIADQIAADEALVKSPPPRPDPTTRRLTPAQIRKRAAETDEERAAREQSERDAQAERERIETEKANVDKLGNTAPKRPEPPVV